MESNARITDFLFNKASGRKIPLNGTFELSPECNFACRMCYVRKSRREILTHDRPMVTLEQWLEIARQARAQGLLYLLLTGGEPFLWPDFWKLYDALIHMGFLVSINTNGSLIDDEAIRKLQELPPTRVNITLYGASDATYERLCGAKGVFSRVDGAISGLKAAGVPVKLNCSLTPYNACDLEAITRYAQEKDIYLQVNTYMFPPIRRDASMVGENDRFTPHEAAYYHMKRYQLQTTPEEYRSFLCQTAEGMEQPIGLDESCIDPVDGKIRCRAGNASFWITWDGWMVPCGMMPEPKVELMNRPFSDAWKELADISDGLTLSGLCAQCPDQKICHSCVAIAVSETGSYSGIPTYLCHMMTEMRKIAAAELAGETE